jgi:hypothetical protein
VSLLGSFGTSAESRLARKFARCALDARRRRLEIDERRGPVNDGSPLWRRGEAACSADLFSASTHVNQATLALADRYKELLDSCLSVTTSPECDVVTLGHIRCDLLP